MMKRLFPVLLLLGLSTHLFAEPGPMGFPFMPGPFSQAGPFVKTEIADIQTELGATKLGDVEVATLLSVRDRLDIARQKDDWVRDAGIHSLLLPGLGQLEQGDTGTGIAFLASDVAVVAGALIGAYYLLPADLRFDRINYFGNDIHSINSAWTSHSFTDYLPAAGVLMGGMALDMTLRQWSAAIARRGATRFIQDGKVQFAPKIGAGFMGFDITY